MSYELFEEICKIISGWQPKNYRAEEKYKNDLVKYLRSTLNKENVLFTRTEYIVKPEHGISKVDIAIDDKIGIELKYDLAKKSKSAIRILRDQVLDHLNHYNYVAVVLCRKTLASQIEEIKSGLGDRILSNTLLSTAKVRLIPKSRS